MIALARPITRRRALRTLAAFAAAGVLPRCSQRAEVAAPKLSPDALRVAERAIRRGSAYLWSRQHASGVFASDVYGVLRRGQSLTPFALESLSRVPPRLDPAGFDRAPAVARSLRALLSMRDPDGALGFADPVADYPCYATGLFLACLGALRPEDWEQHARASAGWLRGQQLRAEAGWGNHSAQGGWGMGTRAPLVPPDAGHVDLSMTRRAIEGLRAIGVAADAAPLVEARDFVLRCRTPNDAFLYSPVELALNKGARTQDGGPLGYGSATTDALLALDALRLHDTPAARDALAWLHTHHRVDENPGISGGPLGVFAKAMRGYYRAGAARCFARLGGPEDWRPQLIDAIAADQAPDGAWRNENNVQKEDDPLVSTPFALQALAACLAAPGPAAA